MIRIGLVLKINYVLVVFKLIKNSFHLKYLSITVSFNR